jgi:Domain of unknown function (DUF4845)
MASKSRQKGISFIVLVLLLAILIGGGLLLAQAFPTFLEYQAALKAINKAKDGGSVVEIRNAFDRAAQIDNITSITGADLEITKNGDLAEVSFAYNKEIHMFGPAWLLLKYTGTSRPGR